MKALIAMSGGVDSSVAAFRMREAGYDCVGCMMRLYAGEAADGGCCSLDDAEDARAVARRLGIPFYVFNYTDAFRREVMEPFADAYRRGRTPNPCIECNRALKFGRLLLRARELGCERIATGHYARVERDGARALLRAAADAAKDQSYVLYTMTQEQLLHTVFPLGEMTKEETRAAAAACGFVNAEKPDSQDICFVPDGDYAAAVERILGTRFPEGDFVSPAGTVLGRHRGVIRYTVGQRRGLGVPAASRLYVCRIDPEANTVTLGEESDLLCEAAWTETPHWIAGEAPAFPLFCRVRLRYHARPLEAAVRRDGDGLRIEFAAPQRAPAPGQAAVFYDGEYVLGGAVLRRRDHEGVLR